MTNKVIYFDDRIIPSKNERLFVRGTLHQDEELYLEIAARRMTHVFE